ncbi:MAG: DUF1080 domain-containing protein [Lentisphaeraceae bacterium]|nr:DUF1080 domain-containing protein [Lentisphaeraceae bacterium]
MKYLILLMATVLASCATAEKNEWQAIFDGSTLNGWEALPGGEWSVKDGSIFGSQEKTEKRHGMLISKKQHSDFEVKMKYKAVKGNSGFYFRVEKVKHVVSVKGFQAEVDANGNGQGGLYETLGRAWVVQPTKEDVAKFFKPQEWNDMTVRAVGRHVVVTVNGVKTAELTNDKGNLKGYFGLQLHGSQDMEIYFKDIYIKDLSNAKHAGTSHMAPKIHDKELPLPPIKEGFSDEVMAKYSKAPEGAIVLFDGTSLDNWKNKNWILKDGIMESNKGNQVSVKHLGSGHYHAEWRVVDKESPGNSGVYIHSLYEVQVFNSHNNKTKIYADGQTAAIYGQYPPAFNVSRPAGEWEYFDIDFTAPIFNEDGSVKSKAYMTVYHNGIRVHDNAELSGPTGHKSRPAYRKTPAELPLLLQDHGNKVQYRNIASSLFAVKFHS